MRTIFLRILLSKFDAVSLVMSFFLWIEPGFENIYVEKAYNTCVVSAVFRVAMSLLSSVFCFAEEFIVLASLLLSLTISWLTIFFNGCKASPLLKYFDWLLCGPSLLCNMDFKIALLTGIT